jgi:hypothetical protein
VSLDTIREITQPWYEKAPTSVTLAYIVVMVLLSYGIFQFLFLMPAKKLGTSGPTTVNFNGNNIQQLTVLVAGGQSVVHPLTGVEAIVENGGFEQGVEGWGTGFFEGLFLRAGDIALGFNSAVANWSVDDHRAHSGRRALRVVHESAYSPNVFSSLSQRIKVTPSRRYEVRFWAYRETSARGAFSLRVLPSRRTQSDEWDRFKGKVDPGVIDRWQEVRVEFESGADAFFDLRFAAEAPLKIWVDDVSVTAVR